MTDKNSDLLIIGGGVIGLSIAWNLSKLGVSVTVLDSGEAGRASPAAAGMLAPLAEAARPGPLLDLMLESLRRYPDFVEALRHDSGSELEICGPGMLRVARTDAEEATLCQAVEWQTGLGLPLYRLTGADVRCLEPAAAPDIQSAISSPSERHIEPRLLLSALSAACCRQKAQILPDKVLGVETFSGRVTAVRTATDCYRVETVIVAGGAWSQFVGAWLGEKIPITPLQGQMLAFSPSADFSLHHTLYTHGAYLVPRADGRIIAGATEEAVGFNAQTTEAGIDSLRLGAAKLVPSLANWPLQSVWAGLRPVSADGLPVLGRARGWENVHFAAGHGRNGILLAPVTGALLADFLLNDAPLPAAFDPARFGATR